MVFLPGQIDTAGPTRPGAGEGPGVVAKQGLGAGPGVGPDAGPGRGTGVDKMSKVFNFSVIATNLKRFSNGQ